jgi:SulP family sulfate permease
MTTQVPDPAAKGRRFVAVHDRPECPQLRIVRIDGSIWFGAVSHTADWLREQLRLSPGQKHLLIVADGVNFVDVSGAELIAQEAERRRKQGGGLYLEGVKSGVCEPLTRGDYFYEIGAERTFDDKSEALAQIVPGLDPEVCRRCTRRIFGECAHQPAPRVEPVDNPD